MGSDAVSNIVLVVEDHAPTREMLCRLLERAGLECVAVGTLAGAMARLSMHPACVLLDLMLPDGVGLELLLAIRRMGLRSRVIISTASTDPDLLGAALALDPELLLQKPHGAAILLDLADAAVRSVGARKAKEPAD